MTDYQPLNCDLHDELEIAALRTIPVTLRWRDNNGQPQQARGIIQDLFAVQGEEFLRFVVAGEPQQLRLDQLTLDSFPLR